MNSPRNLIVVLLALATCGVGWLAWRQQRELAELRVAALSKEERAELQKRLWAAEKRAQGLEEQLTAKGKAAGAEAMTNAVESETRLPDGRVRRVRRDPAGPGGPLNTMMSVMEKPEVQRLMALQQKAQLDSRYAALFKNLNLSPAQLDQFKTLLVEKQTAMQDVVAAARARGIDPLADPEGLKKLIADTQAEVENNIKATLGDAGYARYEDYQQTFPQRNLVAQLQQSLSYTSSPLSEAQAEQLVGILARNASATNHEAIGPAAGPGVNVSVAISPDGPGAGGAMFSVGSNVVAFGGGGPGGVSITDEAIAAAGTILSPPQLQGLQQLREQQLAQQQLQQTLRQSFGTPRNLEAGPTVGSAGPSRSPTEKPE